MVEIARIATTLIGEKEIFWQGVGFVPGVSDGFVRSSFLFGLANVGVALWLGAIAALLSLEPDFSIIGRAVDGDAALALVRDLTPDILLTDIEMPGQTGLDLARRLADERSRTAVVIVTTFARPDRSDLDRSASSATMSRASACIASARTAGAIMAMPFPMASHRARANGRAAPGSPMTT